MVAVVVAVVVVVVVLVVVTAPSSSSSSEVWCFIGKDFQMKIQKLAMASMKGNNPPSAAEKMMRHYRLAMDLLCRQLREGAMLEEEDSEEA